MTKYCLICSAARSGSTLLDLLLGGHSTSASTGEFSFLGKAIALNQTCSCGEKLRDCPAWSSVIAKVREEMGVDLYENPYALRQWDTKASVVIDHQQQTKMYTYSTKLRTLWCDMVYGLDVHKVNPGLKIPGSLQKGVQNTLYLYDVISREWGKDLIIDSSKNVHKAVSLYKACPEKVRIIYLTRDGRGVYYSRRTSGFSRPESIAGWRNYNRRAERQLTNLVGSEGLLRLKYEDLVGDLEGSLDSICQFLGVDYESSMTNLSHGERHLVNGNATMYKRDSGVKLDTRWKDGLVGDEMLAFQKSCGSLNRKLGYI